MSDSTERLLDLTATIVSAHVANNSTQSDALPSLIQTIYSTLQKLEAGGTVAEAAAPVPAVPVKKSVFADHIICLEDGKRMKMMKRHLQKAYGMTPDDYRKKWGLPRDYPMVASDYSKRRSELAANFGLGQKPEARAAMKAQSNPEPVITQVPERKRGRKKAAVAA